MPPMESKIEQYLNNELSEKEKKEFEKALSEDEKLAKEVLFQKELRLFFEKRNPALEEQLTNLGNDFFSDSPKKSPSKNTFMGYFVGLAFVCFMAIFISGLKKSNQEENHLPTLKKTQQPTTTDSNKTAASSAIRQNTVIVNDSLSKSKEKNKAIRQPIAQNTDEGSTFERSELLEALVTQNVRSGEAAVEVNFPPKNYTFYKKENQVYWEISGINNANLPLELFIYNNQTARFQQGQPILKASLDALATGKRLFFAANFNAESGVYYFFLRAKGDMEIIYGDKFFVK